MNANNADIGWIIGNLPDLVVAGVVVLSALFAFYRGFVRETLAIGGWVGAAFELQALYFHCTFHR